jgi:hypothetical protein
LTVACRAPTFAAAAAREFCGDAWVCRKKCASRALRAGDAARAAQAARNGADTPSQEANTPSQKKKRLAKKSHQD